MKEKVFGQGTAEQARMARFGPQVPSLLPRLQLSMGDSHGLSSAHVSEVGVLPGVEKVLYRTTEM